MNILCRNFMEINVAQYGNCYSFNSKYNLEDDTLYKIEDKMYTDSGKRRLSSLTGPSFGLNLIVSLDQIDYMKGGVTKQVRTSFALDLFCLTYSVQEANSNNIFHIDRL